LHVADGEGKNEQWLTFFKYSSIMSSRKKNEGSGSSEKNLAVVMKSVTKIEGGAAIQVNVSPQSLKKMKILEFVSDEELGPLFEEAVSRVIDEKFGKHREQVNALMDAMNSIG